MILIIDDDIAVRTSLQLLLQNESYSVANASSAEEALSVLKNNNISLVIFRFELFY